LGKGWRVIAVSRSAGDRESANENLDYVSADTTVPGSWQEKIESVDVVINLAGATIFHYWTTSYKETVYNSRLLTTRNLVEAIPTTGKITLFSASAMGFYGDRHDDLLTETEPAGDDFLANVCLDWEREALRAEEKGARVVLTRFGTVVDKNGGAMKIMLPPYRLFVGGAMGDGTQWFPWIHLNDLASAFWYLIEHEGVSGAVNVCAPEAIQNREMAKTLGKVTRRPSFLRVPGFAIKLLLGEFGKSILGGQRVVPEKLLSHGFEFRYPDFESAMMEVVGKSRTS
jgi:uncharacterized protein (TIGR01777 family)